MQHHLKYAFLDYQRYIIIYGFETVYEREHNMEEYEASEDASAYLRTRVYQVL